MTREEAIEVYDGLINTKIKEAFEFFAPELAESEDERIRNWLITQLQNNYKGNYWATQAIAYLEKQKEQKPADDEAKAIAYREYERGRESGLRDGQKYVLDNAESYGLCKPAEYLDKDKVYAIMKKLHDLSFSELIPINSDEFKKINEIVSDVRDLLDYPIEQKPAEWSEEDEVAFGDLLWCIEQAAHSAKDENDMGNIWYAEKWLKERLKSLRPQSKEELAKMLQDEYNKGKELGEREGYTKGYDKGYKDANESVSYHFPVMPTTPSGFGCDGTHCTNPHMDCINCPRRTTGGFTASPNTITTTCTLWKPSEEQMRYLLAVINDPNNISAESCYMTIKSLYNDLQKLL